MGRINKFNLETDCADCLEQGKKTKGVMMVNMKGERVVNPSRVAVKNYGGELACLPMLVLCHDHKKRRRNLYDEEWVTLPDAVKFMRKREEKTGVIDGGGGEPSLIQQRLARVYSKE